MEKLFSTWLGKHFRSVIAVIAVTGVVTISGGVWYVQHTVNSPQLSTEEVKNLDVTVYRSPSCGCCGGWIEHLQAEGFQVKDVKTDDLKTLKEEHHLPSELGSCHTAIIDGYVIEGHIPAEDIKRFLAKRPNVAGIAVPGMPIGTPGMEMGEEKEPFTVYSFDQEGNIETFRRHS